MTQGPGDPALGAADGSPLHDPLLQRMLDHAPDRDAGPHPATREAILRTARNAVAPSPLAAGAPARVRPWWQRLWRPAAGSRMPWNAAFATVLVAMFVTVLWHREPVPDARLDAEGPAGRAAAPVPAPAPAQATPPAATAPKPEAVQPAPATAAPAAPPSGPAPAGDDAKAQARTQAQVAGESGRRAAEAERQAARPNARAAAGSSAGKQAAPRAEAAIPAPASAAAPPALEAPPPAPVLPSQEMAGTPAAPSGQVAPAAPPLAGAAPAAPGLAWRERRAGDALADRGAVAEPSAGYAAPAPPEGPAAPRAAAPAPSAPAPSAAAPSAQAGAMAPAPAIVPAAPPRERAAPAAAAAAARRPSPPAATAGAWRGWTDLRVVDAGGHVRRLTRAEAGQIGALVEAAIPADGAAAAEAPGPAGWRITLEARGLTLGVLEVPAAPGRAVRWREAATAPVNAVPPPAVVDALQRALAGR